MRFRVGLILMILLVSNPIFAQKPEKANPEIPYDHWSLKAYDTLVKAGISQYPSHSFTSGKGSKSGRRRSPVTRWELAVATHRALKHIAKKANQSFTNPIRNDFELWELIAKLAKEYKPEWEQLWNLPDNDPVFVSGENSGITEIHSKWAYEALNQLKNVGLGAYSNHRPRIPEGQLYAPMTQYEFAVATNWSVSMFMTDKKYRLMKGTLPGLLLHDSLLRLAIAFMPELIEINSRYLIPFLKECRETDWRSRFAEDQWK